MRNPLSSRILPALLVPLFDGRLSVTEADRTGLCGEFAQAAARMYQHSGALEQAERKALHEVPPATPDPLSERRVRITAPRQKPEQEQAELASSGGLHWLAEPALALSPTRPHTASEDALLRASEIASRRTGVVFRLTSRVQRRTRGHHPMAPVFFTPAFHRAVQVDNTPQRWLSTAEYRR